MFLRKTYLQSRLSLPVAGEHTTDIAMREPITNLWIEFRATNGATDNKKNLVADCIQAIEVIDGSEVIYSLDGYEALALTCNYLNTMPNQLVTELANTVQNLSIVIPFGRFVGDPDFAFDPTRFVNPQVRVKWNLATLNATGANGFVATSLVMTIVATCMEGGASPKAYLMTKEIYSYVPAAGIEYIDLPTDYPYKGLLFRTHWDTKAMYTIVSNMKLHVNQEQYILFNMRMTDLIRYHSGIEPILHYDHCFTAKDTDTIYHILKYADTPSHEGLSADDLTFRWNGVGIGEGVINIDNTAGAVAADVNFLDQVTGYCPFGCVYVNFGRQDEPGEWFPAPDFRQVRLEATGTAAGGHAYACLVQIHPY